MCASKDLTKNLAEAGKAKKDTHASDTLQIKPAKPDVSKNPNRRRIELGRKGEELACMMLEQNGASIIERNWKCHAGEADIIACESGELVFIEVKTRSNIAMGFPEEAITAQKRARYEKIALYYLASHDMPSSRIRFDVIAVTIVGTSKSMIRHHRDAFSLGC